ncbi:MAG: hypothetical protein AUI16_21475 [Alphaproteobacteria bacterium 13_2_20CM_2_64_7]|nr:MAG: hypothetical protein AUI16_21475 [Alphaproteobacteria bacterium 13_2_20CM_2_64_7]
MLSQLTPVPAPTRRQPPDHLGEAERRIWKHVLTDYQLSTIAIDVLITALEAHQRARESRETVQRDGMVVVGRDGQQKQHPLLSVERDARQAWLAGIKALGLEL